MYAMGCEGLLPRYLGKPHPVHKSPYTAVLTWGAFAVVLFLIFRATSHTGLDAYSWLSPQGVIWIVLVQALTALSVFTYFRREHPTEQSWKTTVCARSGEVRAHGSLRQGVGLALASVGAPLRVAPRRLSACVRQTTVSGGLRHSSAAFAIHPSGGDRPLRRLTPGIRCIPRFGGVSYGRQSGACAR
jgi:hypothetical protein